MFYIPFGFANTITDTRPHNDVYVFVDVFIILATRLCYRVETTEIIIIIIVTIIVVMYLRVHNTSYVDVQVEL